MTFKKYVVKYPVNPRENVNEKLASYWLNIIKANKRYIHQMLQNLYRKIHKKSQVVRAKHPDGVQEISSSEVHYLEVLL